MMGMDKMKITSLANNINNSLLNVERSKQITTSLEKKEYKPTSYPQNYYISFGAGKDFQTIYSLHKDTQMPITVRDYIENQEILLSEDEFKKFTELGLKAIQSAAFNNLENCSNIEDIKKAFPYEDAFKSLKDIKSVNIDTPIFNAIKTATNKGIKVFNSKEDITTFLVKKLYLEGKTFKDTIKDTVEIVNPKAQEVKEILDTTSMYDHPRQLFSPLGIEPPNGRTYGRDLQNSDPSFLNGRKAYFSNLTPEQLNEKIKNLLASNEKSKFSMMDAWNHCENVRNDLSKHIIGRVGNLNGGSFDFYDPSFYSKMRLIMNEFWQKYPQYKEELGKEIKAALEKYDRLKGGNPDDFKAYKESVQKTSQEIKTRIHAQREQENPIKTTAEKMLQKIVQKANPMTLKTGASNSDFYGLLKQKVSEKEMNILNGDAKVPEYQTLFPEGIKDKMRGILRTPQYANIFNSQNLAILRELEVSGEINENDINEILFNEKPFNVVMKEITLKYPELNIDNVNRKYDRYKTPLSANEKEKVRTELLKRNKYFSNADTPKLESMLRTQGQYTKFALEENSLNNLSKILFWKEFDKLYGTDYTTNVLTDINSELNITSAIQVIDDIDFTDLLD